MGWSPPYCQPRNGSPPSGFSTLMTTAPRSASNIPAYGPAMKLATSRTRMPCSAPAMGRLTQELLVEVADGCPLGSHEIGRIGVEIVHAILRELSRQRPGRVDVVSRRHLAL